MYQCKKCKKEFPQTKEGLREYKTHCLNCTAETSHNEDKEYRIRVAKRQNSCRGYYEGDKDNICKRYARCEDCWNDFE